LQDFALDRRDRGTVRFANICLTDDDAFFFERPPGGDVCVVVQSGDTISSPAFSSRPMARASAKVMVVMFWRRRLRPGHSGRDRHGRAREAIIASLARLVANAPQVLALAVRK